MKIEVEMEFGVSLTSVKVTTDHIKSTIFVQ